MAIYRKTLDEIKGARAWSDAELKVLKRAHTGVVSIGDDRPEKKTEDKRIRAELVVHCVLGGCEKLNVSQSGVSIEGAWIAGKIDLEGCRSDLPISLYKCFFDTAPLLQDARLGGLFLPGCKLPGLKAHRLQVQTDVHLRNKFKATGRVDLAGARIEGQLACGKGTFEGDGEIALVCEAADIGANVFLDQEFEAKGEVNLVHARIGGALICEEGSFEGGLLAEGMQIQGGFFFKNMTSFKGPLYLTDAEVGRLEDDKAAWAGAKPLKISGFRYKRLSGDIRVSDRLKLLQRKQERFIVPAIGEKTEGHTLKKPTRFIPGQYEKQFDPQPYSQLAKVLREQGNSRGATEVLHRRDQRAALAAYHRAQAGVDGTWSAGGTAILSLFGRPFVQAFDLVFGMGHKPLRAVVAVFLLWLCSSWFYGQVWDAGQFAPTSDVVLTSTDWTDQVIAYESGQTDVKPLVAWLETPSAKDYESFSHYLYAFDVFVPLDALGQEVAWAPSPARGDWGWWGFYLKPVIQILGWVITAVGAAAVTGLVGRRE